MLMKVNFQKIHLKNYIFKNLQLPKTSLNKTISSPCVGICDIDFNTNDICKGCGRSVDEIANWVFHTSEEKILIKKKAENRMKKINS